MVAATLARLSETELEEAYVLRVDSQMDYAFPWGDLSAAIASQ
jgi:hypothetical protein